LPMGRTDSRQGADTLIVSSSTAPSEPPLSKAAYLHDHTGRFGLVALCWQILMLPLFYFTSYETAELTHLHSSSLYHFYVGVALMMFVGFGYLMTFLKDYGLGAVGSTMFITCLGMQWAMLVEKLMVDGPAQYKDAGTLHIKLSFMDLLNANFAVAAVLISFGGLIGKVSPTQIAYLTIAELLCYAANKVFFLTNFLHISDVGGTIIIHVFGAYFGLAACAGLGPAANVERNGSSYTSDVFSLVGTVFLWLFWPSFVASGIPIGTSQHGIALLNTVLALLASSVVTFGLTPYLMGNKLSSVAVQNATLAGGVSIGATANIAMGPFWAVIVGMLAGTISCVGFCKAPEWTGKYDTCGINNLHGMPGIFGGLVSAALPLMLKDTGIDPMMQLAGLFGTLAVAIITGYATGLVLNRVTSPVAAYSDASFWSDVEVSKAS